MSDNLKVMGVDIGGTKIAVCLADAKGDILSSRRIPMQGDYQTVLPQIIAAIGGVLADQHLAESDIAALGICAPGPLDIPKGLLLRSPNMNWGTVPIRDDIARAVKMPISLDNDANAGVLAEWFFGAGKGKKDLIYLTMSTGVGGGVVAGGRLLTGTTGNAAELGHIVLDINGPECGCGQRGCLEAYCGGASVKRRLQDILRYQPHHAMYQLPCVDGKFDNLNFQAVREGAKAKIPLAMEMWEEICMRLAQGIGICLCTFNPELMVLGTSAYYAGDFLLDPVRHYLPRFTWNDFYDHCEIRLSGLGLKVGELAGVSVAFNYLFEHGQWKA